MVHDEKRTSQRIQVEVPVYIGQEESVSRDVSMAGIYFLTDHFYTKGGRLDFSLELAYAMPGELVRLGCQGEVVRVESRNGKYGVAAKINTLQTVN